MARYPCHGIYQAITLTFLKGRSYKILLNLTTSFHLLLKGKHELVVSTDSFPIVFYTHKNNTIIQSPKCIDICILNKVQY